MKVRVLDSALITDFINAGFSGDKIRLIGKEYADGFAVKITNEALFDWEVTFRFYYNHLKKILIYLKERSYPIEKYKEITIHIPIPMIEKVVWGVALEQYLYQNEDYLDEKIKNFHCLDVDYSKFDNREDYILDCVRRSIEYCFAKGFTINGIKVKI